MAKASQQASARAIPEPKIPWAALGAVLLAWALLLARLGAKSLWCDEIYSLETARLGLPDMVARLAQIEHPPLHFLMLWLWVRAFGEGDYAIRLLSVFLGLLSLPLLYRLARKMLEARTSLLALYLLAISPFFVLYARMARQYTQTMLGALLSCLFFLQLLERPSRRAWLGYILASAGLLYTFYPTVSILLAENLVALWASRRLGWAFLGRWLGAQLAIAALLIPWFPLLLPQLGYASAPALNPFNFLVDTSIRLLYPFYAFGLGETIFPWNPLAAPGVLLVGALLALGAWQALRGRERLRLMLALLVVPLAVNALLVTYIARRETVQTIPRSSSFVLPFFLVLLAAGFTRLRSPQVSAGLVLGLTLLDGYALYNYYQDREFHNLNYTVPRREMVEHIVRSAHPGDVLVADPDLFLDYYHAKAGSPLPLYPSFPQEETLERLRAEAPARVWYASIGRFGNPWAGPTEFQGWLGENYRRVESRGFAPEDARMQAWKARILGRPGREYHYKAMVELYERR